MWRSFFYAVGIGLFTLGLQALVTDHVMVPKDTRLQKIIKKILDDEKGPAGNVAARPQQSGPSTAPRSTLWRGQAQNGFGGVNTGSRFGPSRFAGPAYGTGYGGARINSNFNSPPPSNSGVFRTQPNSQLASFRNNGAPRKPAATKAPALQKFLIREWMPWSLLATGAIIFLYTRTIDKRRTQD